ncbi:MAG: hypothetical protein P8X97_00890 [Candidatus Bathyarchaeota archaeon]
MTYLTAYLSNPLFLVPTISVSFGCAVAWFILSAKKHQPISNKEVEMLWKSHKHFNKCKAKNFLMLYQNLLLDVFACVHIHIDIYILKLISALNLISNVI